MYRWATAPYVLLAGLLGATLAGPIGHSLREHRWLDCALLAVVVGVWLQRLPLPAAWLAAISPRTEDVIGALRLQAPAVGPAAVSVAPEATVWAAAILTANVVVFLAARALFSHGGARWTIRALSWLGIIFATLGLAQAASGSGAVYWWWEPLGEGADPFSTFINRNHFATWVIMAVPACFGYLATRLLVSTESSPRLHWTRRVSTVLDGRTIFLLFAVVLMTVALLVNLSRSGMVGLTCAGIFFLVVSSQQLDRRRGRWLLVYLALSVVLVVLFTDLDALVRRLDQTVATGDGRIAIWRETLPIISDFWITGTGGGTYETAMRVYQQSDRAFYFNQAHNQYLQIAAEGGLILSVPALLALVTFIALARRRLREDHSPMVWVRIGASSGLLAVMVQNLWETGLRMPANAALAAVLAAAVLHTPRRRVHGEEARHGTAARL